MTTGVAMSRGENPELAGKKAAERDAANEPDGVASSGGSASPVSSAPGRDAGVVPMVASRRPVAEMYFDVDAPMSDASERFGPLVLEIQGDAGAEDASGKVIAPDPGLGDAGLGIARMARRPGLTAATAARRRKSSAAKPGILPQPKGPVLAAPVDRELARSRWAAGGAFDAHSILGAHLTTVTGLAGARFAVWAPSALRVSVIGDFNEWHPTSHELLPDGAPGVWSGFIPGAMHGMLYKYRIQARDGRVVERADPFARCAETPPRTASVIWNLAYTWTDDAWLAGRKRAALNRAPISIYQVHLGSWMRRPEEGNRRLTYHELAPRLARHAKSLGFTHVELLPVMEHPMSSVAGFETIGYFTPTGRHGTPEGLMHLIDTLHREGLGVILSWCPTGFSLEDGWLSNFDGSAVYEDSDARMGRHPDGRGGLFDLSKGPVRSFLLSSAMFWLETYHADGVRVCDMAPLLYRDHHRGPGQWTPNRRGGSEHEEGVAFLRTLSDAAALRTPGALLLADDVTCHPGVTRPTSMGGLGFTAKHDHKWTEDSLRYFGRDPIFRSFHHDEVTGRALYAASESFVVGLGHTSACGVSPVARMFGDEAMKLAHLRAMLALAYAQPGVKLLFMGTEFGQPSAWDPEKSLDWHCVGQPGRAGLQRLVAALNALYRREPALHEASSVSGAFTWIDSSDRDRSLVSFVRRGGTMSDAAPVLVIGNFTPVARGAQRFGVPEAGPWRVVLNTDAREFGGGGTLVVDARSKAAPCHGQPHSITVDVPGLSVVMLRKA